MSELSYVYPWSNKFNFQRSLVFVRSHENQYKWKKSPNMQAAINKKKNVIKIAVKEIIINENSLPRSTRRA